MEGKHFIKYLQKIDQTNGLSYQQEIKAWYRLFVLLLESISDENNINFTTLFSRIAYVGAKWKFSGTLLFLMHSFRRGVEKELIQEINASHYKTLARFLCVELINQAYQQKLPQFTSDSALFEYFKPRSEKVLSFSPVRSGLVLEIDVEKRRFRYVDKEEGSEEYIVQFDIAHVNEIFTDALLAFFKLKRPPIHINLIDVETLENKTLVPKAFVLEPDYLLDVTAIANAFKTYGTEALESVVNKFRPNELSIYLLIGNIANFMLDELINQPSISFDKLLPKIFSSQALLFSSMNDKNVLETIKILKKHFFHLQRTVSIEFPKEGIQVSRSYLEPSFYSRDYGIQGRLDLLHEHKDIQHYDIVELKSGSPYFPNNYGLSVQHYTQTLLYDLIIKSVYRGKKKTSNYILYSKEKEWNLRNAPVLKSQQYEALKVRNELMYYEFKLASCFDDNESSFLEGIRPQSMPKLKGFSLKYVEAFHHTFKQLRPHERSYFKVFTQFIAREHIQAKIGEHGLSKSNGLAALWLEDKEEKKDRFAILDYLKLVENHAAEVKPLLSFEKTKQSPELQKFRIGDIVVLYPDTGVQSVLYNQIFKCNVVALVDNRITLQLRSRQYNQRIFSENEWWAIEGDVLDGSFLSMYRNLYELFSAPPSVRDLLLGAAIPRSPESEYVYHSEELTEEQNQLLNQMIQAKDYYLLWGPPGTGKTSIMIKHLVKYLYHYSSERILIAAYTNRAVDEICEAALEALPDVTDPIIRVGSSFSTDPRFRAFLLDHQVQSFTQRKDVLDLLNRNRIIISTISSIYNRVELFNLYKFDRLIIDEASQILEPMLVGLLSRFPRWTLIGDHKQLPAVVVQKPNNTQVNDEDLNNLGITDTRMSLFERLYRRCLEQGWIEVIGILKYQGRMHREIMQFPNIHFYEGKLAVLSHLPRLQKELPEDHNKVPPARMVYIPTPAEEDFSWKTNSYEAEMCRYIVDNLSDHYKLLEETVGIITPYRAQIAMIKKTLGEEAGLKNIMVDTVERFQGGAKDIIILSLCTNQLNQLENLIQISEDGIDRKLNVALTRARDRIFILGNEEILSTDPIYAELIQHCYRWDLDLSK